MSEADRGAHAEIFSRVQRSGKRTYFFDVRETKAGDFYLILTESKREQQEDGSTFYRKHKIYLYKEDFEDFAQNLDESMRYIIGEKGRAVISERHSTTFKGNKGGRAEPKSDGETRADDAEA